MIVIELVEHSNDYIPYIQIVEESMSILWRYGSYKEHLKTSRDKKENEMKLYKLGLRADQTLQKKTLLTLKTQQLETLISETKQIPLCLLLIYCLSSKFIFGLLCDNGAISCDSFHLSASKMLSLFSRGCLRGFGRGGGLSFQFQCALLLKSTALTPKVTPVLGSCMAQLSPTFDYSNSCSVVFSPPETVQTRREYSNILKVLKEKNCQSQILYPPKIY